MELWRESGRDKELMICVGAEQCEIIGRRRNNGSDACDPDGKFMRVHKCDGHGRRPADSPTRLRDTSSGAPSALREIHRQGVRNRNDILLLSVVYSLSYEIDRVLGRSMIRRAMSIAKCSAESPFQSGLECQFPRRK